MNNELFFINSEDDIYQGPDYQSNMPLQYNSEVGTNSSLQTLIDWVNSFNDPYCLLVNSVNDLKDGKNIPHFSFLT